MSLLTIDNSGSVAKLIRETDGCFEKKWWKPANYALTKNNWEKIRLRCWCACSKSLHADCIRCTHIVTFMYHVYIYVKHNNILYLLLCLYQIYFQNEWNRLFRARGHMVIYAVFVFTLATKIFRHIEACSQCQHYIEPNK